MEQAHNRQNYHQTSPISAVYHGLGQNLRQQQGHLLFPRIVVSKSTKKCSGAIFSKPSLVLQQRKMDEPRKFSTGSPGESDAGVTQGPFFGCNHVRRIATVTHRISILWTTACCRSWMLGPVLTHKSLELLKQSPRWEWNHMRCGKSGKISTHT